MELEEACHHLEELANRLGISVRYEPLRQAEYSASSGSYRIRGRYFCIIDSSSSLSERISCLSQCLRQINLEDVYMVPAVRRLVERGEDTFNESPESLG